MKKTIFIVFIAFCFTCIAYADTQRQLFDKGVLLFKQGKYQQAVDEFSKLIKLAPENADAFKNRGVSYMKQEKFDLAIKDFEVAKKIFPELKGLYSNLGVAWYYKKEYEKAIENYDLELEMAPRNPIAYFNRALCLTELGRNQDALEDLEQTLDLRPDFYWAICYKADLLALEGETGRAIETYEAAIRIDPENAYAIDGLAKLRKKKTPGKMAQKQLSRKDAHKKYALQTGAFRVQANAATMRKKLINNGFDSRILTLKDAKDRDWYLVRSGSYASQDETEKVRVSLEKKLGIKAMVRPQGTW